MTDIDGLAVCFLVRLKNRILNGDENRWKSLCVASTIAAAEYIDAVLYELETLQTQAAQADYALRMERQETQEALAILGVDDLAELTDEDTDRISALAQDLKAKREARKDGGQDSV